MFQSIATEEDGYAPASRRTVFDNSTRIAAHDLIPIEYITVVSCRDELGKLWRFFASQLFFIFHMLPCNNQLYVLYDGVLVEWSKGVKCFVPPESLVLMFCDMLRSVTASQRIAAPVHWRPSFVDLDGESEAVTAPDREHILVAVGFVHGNVRFFKCSLYREESMKGTMHPCSASFLINFARMKKAQKPKLALMPPASIWTLKEEDILDKIDPAAPFRLDISSSAFRGHLELGLHSVYVVFNAIPKAVSETSAVRREDISKQVAFVLCNWRYKLSSPRNMNNWEYVRLSLKEMGELLNLLTPSIWIGCAYAYVFLCFSMQTVIRIASRMLKDGRWRCECK